MRSIALAACMLVGAVAFAESNLAPQKPEAAQHYERGLRKYNLLHYAEAIAEFEAGYEIEPAPNFLYSLAQAYRLNGNCKKAIGLYQAFLRNDIPAKMRDATAEQMQRCEEARAQKPEAVVAPAAALATPVQRERPVYKKWWLWTTVAVVAVGVGLGVGLGLGLKHDPSPPKTPLGNADVF